MKSKTQRPFWILFDALPAEVQRQAREKFKLWSADPNHGSLQFKELEPRVWSVRINRSYRVLGYRVKDEIVWYWIGTHGDYDHKI